MMARCSLSFSSAFRLCTCEHENCILPFTAEVARSMLCCANLNMDDVRMKTEIFQDDGKECASVKQEASQNPSGNIDFYNIEECKPQTKHQEFDSPGKCVKSRYFQVKKEEDSSYAYCIKHEVETTDLNFSKVHIKWIPPRSPFNLLQESLYHDPWQLLIATIFLNKTSAKLAATFFWKFMENWSTPQSLQNATLVEVAALMKPLGLNVTRAIQIKHFTYDFLSKDWQYPKELSGIGQYGNDSYRIFCINEWKLVKPRDSMLKRYVNWLWENCDILGIDWQGDKM